MVDKGRFKTRSELRASCRLFAGHLVKDDDMDELKATLTSLDARIDAVMERL